MKPLFLGCLAAGVLAFAVGCGSGNEATTPSQAQQTNAAAGANPLTAPVDYLGAAAAAKKTAVRVVDLTSVQKAVQMFDVSEGRHPKDLQELVTGKYLPRLPELPTGMRYDYDPATGQVKVVSQ